MKKLALLTIALLLCPAVFADTIEVQMEEDWWSTEAFSEEMPAPVYWDEEQTWERPWFESHLMVLIQRRDNQGNVTTIRNDSFRIRETSRATIDELAGNINNLYGDLANKEVEIDLALNAVRDYLASPNKNDKFHPNVSDLVISKTREKVEIESTIAEKTNEITETEGSGLPGWHLN